MSRSTTELMELAGEFNKTLSGRLQADMNLARQLQSKVDPQTVSKLQMISMDIAQEMIAGGISPDDLMSGNVSEEKVKEIFEKNPELAKKALEVSDIMVGLMLKVVDEKELAAALPAAAKNAGVASQYEALGAKNMAQVCRAALKLN